jgi:hypothetical protein
MFQYFSKQVWVFHEPPTHKIKTFLKTSFYSRCVKYKIMNLFPIGISALPANNTYKFLELISFCPELAVQGSRREIPGKPFRSVKVIPLARNLLFACPISTYTIEFLAHPPSIDINFLVPAMCKHYRCLFLYITT